MTKKLIPAFIVDVSGQFQRAYYGLNNGIHMYLNSMLVQSMAATELLPPSLIFI